MTGEHVERRLVAVLAADVAGYSRLMGADEEGTLAQLKAIRKTLVDPTIAAHRGRIFNTAGDSVIADFASAVDAVACAVAVQQAMAQDNAAPPVGEMIFTASIRRGPTINPSAMASLKPTSRPAASRMVV